MTAAQHGRSTAEPIALRERASATPRGPERAPRALAEPSIASAPGARILTLAAQQEWFAQAVMTPESEAAPVGAAAAASILTPGPKLDALSRLEIYRGAYHARLIECLLDDYPAVAATLGEEGFAALCRKYILVHPSTGASLNSFGRHMEQLCRAEATEPSALASRTLAAFVADLAALEWALVDVIHGASADPLTMAALATIPSDRWGDAKLVATPAFRLLRFEHPANRYFQAFREALAPAVPAPERSAVAVYRSGPTIWRMDLSDAAFDLLHALTSGQSLAAALDGASSALSGIDEREAAGRVSAWFRDWVSSGLFSGVELA